MEFQFGTNWAAFSRAAGGVIGQTLAMEGVFSFFLESSFPRPLSFRRKAPGRVGHWFAAFMVLVGSWLSGYLIVATDAWMQHPVGYTLGPNGDIRTGELLGAAAQSLGAVAIRAHDARRGANRMLRDGSRGRVLSALGNAHGSGKIFVRVGVIVGRDRRAIAALSHRRQPGRHDRGASAHNARRHGRTFPNATGAPIAILGQPDVRTQRLDNPLVFPRALSFLTYRAWMPKCGLDPFPRIGLARHIPLLYYSYHIMVGLGTIFIAIIVVAALQLWRGTLYSVAADALDTDAGAAVSLTSPIRPVGSPPKSAASHG